MIGLGRTHRVAGSSEVHGEHALANDHAHVACAGAGRLFQRDERKIIVHGCWGVAGLQGQARVCEEGFWKTDKLSERGSGDAQTPM